MSFSKRELERKEGLEQYAECLAEETGAIIDCPSCGDAKVYAEDPGADRATYAAATNAWKQDENGCTREELMDAVKFALTNANTTCPACGAD